MKKNKVVKTRFPRFDWHPGNVQYPFLIPFTNTQTHTEFRAPKNTEFFVQYNHITFSLF